MPDQGQPGEVPTWEGAGKRDPRKPRARRRALRIVLISLGSLLVLLLVLVALAPTIAGAVAPGYARDAINRSINGKVDVAGVSLGWFGDQRIGPVTIQDRTGEAVARVNITVSRGLFGLARSALGLGAMDLGKTTVSGSATVVRRPDGTTNLQDLLAKPAPAGGPAPSGQGTQRAGAKTKLPQVTASVVLDKLDIRFIDQRRAGQGGAASAVRIPALSGTASIADSKTADAALTGDLLYGPDAEHISTPGGSIGLTAHADALTDSAGNLTPSKTKIDIKADAKDVATVIADAIAAMDSRLVASVGDRLQASVHAAGTMQDADATIAASSRAFNADLAFKATGGVLTTARPGKIALQTATLPAFSPDLDQALKTGAAKFDRLPDATVVIDNMKIPLPTEDKPLDLRSATLTVTVETTEASGIVSVPTPDGKPGQPQPFRIAPLKARLASDEAGLGRAVTLVANSSATISGNSAGTLAVNLAAVDPLDAAGKPRSGIPGRLQGSVNLTGVATAIAQPFADAAGIDLARDVGPQLDLALLAAATDEEASGGGDAKPAPASTPAASATQGAATAGLPAQTHLALDVKSANISTTARLLLEQKGQKRILSSKPKGVEVRIANVGPMLASRFKNSGITVEFGGPVSLTITDLVADLDRLNKAGGPDLRAVSATVRLQTGPMSGHLVAGGQPARAWQLAPLNASIDAADLSKGASFKAATSATLDNSPAGTLDADVRVSGLVNPDGTPARGLPIIEGRVALKDVPTALVEVVAPKTPAAAPAPGSPPPKPGFDVARLLGEAVGPTVTATLTAERPQNASAPRPVNLALESAHFNGGMAASISDTSLSVSKLDFRGQMTPELAAAFIDSLGPGLASRPTLASPATITVSATPFSVPLAGAAPDWSRARDASLKVGLEGKAIVNNVVLKSESGPPRDIGAVGLESLLLTANFPLSSLAPGSAAKPAQISLTGGVLGSGEKRIVDLKGGGRVNIAGGRPAGDLNADLNLSILDARWLDMFLGETNLVAGGIGDTATVDASALVQFPKAGNGRTAAAAAPAFERATLSASIKSPRLATTQPFKATALPDHISIDSPMILKWTMDPVWANANLLGAKDLKDGQTLPARFDSPLNLTLTVPKLTLALGSGVGLLKPGVFGADIQVSSPGASLIVGEGNQAAKAKLSNLKARATSGREAGAMGFNLDIEDAGGGPAPGGKPAVALTGGIYGIADAAGNPTPRAARITLNGSATGVPTALVDALTKQRGILVAALGPAVNVTLTTQGLSESGGNLSAEMRSQRAEANLKGTIKEGVFIAQGQPEVKLVEITPDLGKRMVKGLPAIGTIEKKSEDGPALLRATALTLPLDGQMNKLNGQIVVDLGQARFQASNIFSEILKVTGQKRSSDIGRRLEPITIHIKDGVMSYDKVSIPLGEFTIASEGVVDLVNRRLDVRTFVPFGALTDEAAGLFNSGLGKALGGALPALEQATAVPFHTTGSFDNPETKPDLELFAKQFGKSLLRPDQIIGGSLKDIFKKMGGK